MFVNNVKNKVFSSFIDNWYRRINSEVGPSGRGRNKLRMLFKTQFAVEKYCKIILPPRLRTAFSRLRCGVASRIETGRYEGLPENSRLCPFCNVVENENARHFKLSHII